MNNVFHDNKGVIVLELTKNYVSTLQKNTRFSELPDKEKKFPYYSVSVLFPFRNVLSFPSDLSYRSFSLSRNGKINWKPSCGGSQEDEML